MSRIAFVEAYERMRAIARSIGDRGQTLTPTEVVHEAWIRLEDRATWTSEAHFRALAAKAMRAVVVDRLRARSTDKRGGGWRPVPITGVPGGSIPVELLDLCSALDRLDGIDPRLGRVAELKLFGGLEMSDIASILEVSERTVKRDWRCARAWLATELSPS